MRFTIRNLRAEIEEINGRLEKEGFAVRFIIAPRNGYQAVDEYPVWPDGTRRGTYVNCNVGCGTSREVHNHAWRRYYDLVNRARDEGVL